MPETPYTVQFETTKGAFQAKVHPEWAPEGAARLKELVENGFFQDVAFFRVLSGFVAQFGIHGDPAVSAEWRNRKIADDPVEHTNVRGTMTFATAGPDTRTTQLFVNLEDNTRLDSMGFSPVAEITAGMDVVDSLNDEYGEGAPRGTGPDQGKIQAEGNDYLKSAFPALDYITSASIVPTSDSDSDSGRGSGEA